MSNNLIQYAFVAGEIAPRLFHRTDLEKYDLGVALGRNFFVDYRGGLSSRPGTKFIDYVQHPDKPTLFIPFEFAPDVANTYVILFGHQYIRFIQDDGYILETGIALSSITKADPGVVETSAAHGFSVGDWVKFSSVGGMTELNGGTYQVGTIIDSTHFELRDVFGNDLNTATFTAYTSGGTVARIYTLVSPYAVADLGMLRAHQIFDTIRLTHKGYKRRNLTRIGDANWTLTEEVTANDTGIPSGLDVTSDGGTGVVAGVVFTVTATNYLTGLEGLAAPPLIKDGIGDHTQSYGSLEFTWTGVADTAYYTIYRSIISKEGGDCTAGMELGYIGRAYGLSFIDNNIIPDFTTQPPVYNDPFADGKITYINVTAGGTGYAKTDTISIIDPDGSGFSGYLVVSDAGVVEAVVIVNGGSGYTGPSVSITTGGGSGADFDITVGEASGNNPALSITYQQRQLYAATENQPLTIWGSRVGLASNFDTSRIITAADSYEFDLDSNEVTPIKHLRQARGGLLMMTAKGVWQLRGGTDNEAVTPINALADPQSYNGVSDVEPLYINNDLLYIEGRGTTVRLLSYNDFAKVYAGQDMSILANHLFAENNQVTRWSYESDPFKLVYGVRQDGVLLTFTIVKEQEVFAWTRNQTKGFYRDVITIQEGTQDSTYFVVERYINGNWVKFIEKQSSRQHSHVEESWCVDAGLQLGHTTPAANLTPAAATGTGVSFTADASVFVPGDVGKIIRAGGGKAEITAYVSGTEVTVTIKRDLTEVIPEDDNNTPVTIDSGDWTMDAEVSSITGLDHLEGEYVTGLADGNVISPRQVVNGGISLDSPASYVTLGLSFVGLILTLPPSTKEAIIEGRRKRIVGTMLRSTESRGLQAGDSLDRMYEAKDRTLELYGEPIGLLSKMEYITIDAGFEENAQIYYRQPYPLPATILGHVLDLEVGDETD